MKILIAILLLVVVLALCAFEFVSLLFLPTYYWAIAAILSVACVSYGVRRVYASGRYFSVLLPVCFASLFLSGKYLIFFFQSAMGDQNHIEFNLLGLFVGYFAVAALLLFLTAALVAALFSGADSRKPFER